MMVYLKNGIAKIGDLVDVPHVKMFGAILLECDSSIPFDCKVKETADGTVWTFPVDTLRAITTTDVLSLADTLRATPKKEIVDKRLLTLPTDSTERKNYPLLSGLLNYFPAALAGAANTSKLGNDKHNPGQPLHHARGKSMDHGDCIIRHLMDTENLKASAKLAGSSVKDSDILLEANQLVWRALAYSQQLHEQFGAPVAPAAKE